MPVMEQIALNPTTYPPNDPAGFYTLMWSGAGNVTAAVTPVDISSTSGCAALDFTGFPAGNIALLQRGTCTFQDKAKNAEAAGAAGVIIFNDGQDGRTSAFQGTLGEPVSIPVVGTSYAIGMALQVPGTVVRLDINTVSNVDSTSQNVIGTLAGPHPTEGIVYLGAALRFAFPLARRQLYFGGGGHAGGGPDFCGQGTIHQSHPQVHRFRCQRRRFKPIRERQLC